MEYKTLTLPSFLLIGSPQWTSNKNMQEIGAHWQRFYSENIKKKIPNKVDDEILGLYTEYEGDHTSQEPGLMTKPYTLIIGCRVSSIANLPDGLVFKTVPASKYTVFTAKGKFPECLMHTWQEIWNSNIERAFNTDFEVYGERSYDVNNAEVEIYISVK